MQVLNDDGRTTSMREKILTIAVKRGWKEGTRITFPKEGDQGPNKILGQCRGAQLKCLDVPFQHKFIIEEVTLYSHSGYCVHCGG